MCATDRKKGHFELKQLEARGIALKSKLGFRLLFVLLSAHLQWFSFKNIVPQYSASSLLVYYLCVMGIN